MLKRLASLALCACAPVHAMPVLDSGRIQQLANTPYWIALGHYETAKLGGWRSYVDDDAFFLARFRSCAAFASYVYCQAEMYGGLPR